LSKNRNEHNRIKTSKGANKKLCLAFEPFPFGF